MIMKKTAKKALVTGGAGFIGSNLVDKLIKRGYKVSIIDDLSTGKRENLNPKAKFHKVDIRQLKKIKPLFAGVDYVFHLAAWPRVQLSIDDPALTNDINLNGTLNVLLAAREAKVKKVIFSSSCAIYGDQPVVPQDESLLAQPLSPYGLQKYLGEHYGRLFYLIYGLPFVALRYFNVFGPRQSTEGAYAMVTSVFIKQKKAGQPLTITGTGQNKRDYVSVVDVARANILAAENAKVGRGEAINIGSGRNWSVNELAKMVGGPIKHIAPRIEPKEILADIALAKNILGWQPTISLSDWIVNHKKEQGLE